jgi:uncharacterized membrane protein
MLLWVSSYFVVYPFIGYQENEGKEKRRTVLMFSIALASKIEYKFLISLSSFFMLYWVSFIFISEKNV